MSEALIALLGAVLGAALTGAGKLIQVRVEHRLASRTSARMVLVVLDEALSDMKVVEEHGAASPVAQWGHYESIWNHHQLDLARVIDAEAFQEVAKLFVYFRNLAGVLDSGLNSAEELRESVKTVRSVAGAIRPKLEWAGLSGSERSAAWVAGKAGARPLGDWGARLLD